ncbi:GNAT family N-acetyltransferase [Bosea psychrotolerans]|uniref:Diamine N-acetyltransferase n=1 Tax=Bosea psychrotolerans TaxID=1871628 RepID=A0A2S4M4K1_9HYPH|nr:GNAT family N-acetyltransferase [Bosea psychrotolerans]POR49630.1 diamine N-acetyltransferase [Bosea psychrotolerans]
MSDVALRDITAATVRAICALEVRQDQKGFVAPNAISIAQAYFEPAARFKAIYAAETPVGFLMWRPGSESGVCYLWRFMIDHRHQRNGYGKTALKLLFQALRDQRFHLLKTSIVQGSAGPLEFYRSLGFRETGETVPNGESLLLLSLLMHGGPGRAFNPSGAHRRRRPGVRRDGRSCAAPGSAAGDR